MRTPLALLALVLALPAWSATVPIGPPVSHLGDPLPIPVRTLWVDRASRGGPCSDTNACTSQTAPCCTLARANQVSQAGDRIEVRAGANGGADGYWEADEAGGKWNGRGRDGPSPEGSGPPPARIPACRTTALGSCLGCDRQSVDRARDA